MPIAIGIVICVRRFAMGLKPKFFMVKSSDVVDLGNAFGDHGDHGAEMTGSAWRLRSRS